ncbi:MAG: hypothetical protein PSV36_09630 [Algoriphagus sp.]|nr:hypothetical protein [Algoriphagus sp.]
MLKLFKSMNSWLNLAILTCLLFLFNFLLSSQLPADQALDLRFAYSVQEAYDAIGMLDFETREIYRYGIWALDLPYMIIYGLLFSGLLFKIWKTQKVLILPLGVVLMDFFENLMVLRILKLFPMEDQLIASLASLFTTTKWLLVGLMILTILYGLVHNFSSRKVPSGSQSPL